MPLRPQPPDPPLQAVAALDEFIADLVQRARRAGIQVPARLFDWAAGEGSWVVQRLLLRRLHAGVPLAQGIEGALRCAVRHWTAPYLFARFEALRPLLPELQLERDGDEVAVLLRTGRWRCGAEGCAWRLCED